MPRGGKRQGAGRKKGQLRLDKEAARELLRRRVFKQLTPLVDAQIANAKGIAYLVVRDKKTGKFVRVTEAMARRKQEQLEANEEIIEVWEKDPSVQAFTDLLNRAIDKPAEHVELTGKDGDPIEVQLVQRLAAARQRVKAST